MKITLRIAAIAVALLLFSQPPPAHAGAGKSCDAIIASDKAPEIPNLSGSEWQEIEQVRLYADKKLNLTFTYTFFHDRNRPDIRVAAMTVYGIHPATGMAQKTIVRSGKAVYTYASANPRAVCVRSIVGKHGNEWGLGAFMDRILRIAEVKK